MIDWEEKFGKIKEFEINIDVQNENDPLQNYSNLIAVKAEKEMFEQKRSYLFKKNVKIEENLKDKVTDFAYGIFKKPETKKHEKNEDEKKCDEYLKKIDSLESKLENKFLKTMDDWLKDIQQEESSAKKIVYEKVKSGEEYLLLPMLELQANYLEKNSERIQSLYVILKENRREEPIGEVESLLKSNQELIDYVKKHIEKELQKAYI